MVRRFPSLCALKCCLFSVPRPSRGCQRGLGEGAWCFLACHNSAAAPFRQESCWTSAR